MKSACRVIGDLSKLLPLLILFFVFTSFTRPCVANEATVVKAIKTDGSGILKEKDQHLNDLYNGLLLSLSASEKDALQTEQRAWLKKRNNDFVAPRPIGNASSPFPQTLSTMYEERIQTLADRLNKLASIPAEAMVKYPLLWSDLREQRFMPPIEAKNDLRSLPDFRALRQCIGGLESGRWVTTSYMQWAGTIYRDIGASVDFFEEKLSFAPQLILVEGPADQKLKPLVAWSYEGIWNRKAYQSCEALYKPAAEAMSDYYRRYYNLSAYADRSADLLAAYVGFRDNRPNKIMSSPAFALFRDETPSLEKLKNETVGFSQWDWNVGLAMALLNHAPVNVIEWLIESGAQVNVAIYDEYPLMRAVEQPEIIALLLQKKADPEKATPYGKTALFYAVQFNQLETVKLLVAAGADINHPINSLEDIKAADGPGPYLVEKVAGFTPLVYSLAYASPDVTDYLRKHGATTGSAPAEIIHSWVIENSKMSEAEFQQRIAL